ncbi:MAG: hypothetical protein U0L73_11030 [Ruminococcus bromii]|nr:hypothetical protein [Ruminococcus bromii]
MSKTKKSVKHKKKFPPLSKQDKFLYAFVEISGGIVLLSILSIFEAYYRIFIFKDYDILAVEERYTVILIIPVCLFFLFLILKSTYSKVPIFGNKNVDYFNTAKYKTILPLFDKRYKFSEKYKEYRKKYIKIIIIYFCVFAILLSIGIMGCFGRHEFNSNGIVTYGIFNNKVAEYSYNDVESYSLNADTYYISRTRGMSYRTYDVNLVVEMTNGETFIASYDMARDIYALEKIDNILKDKNKSVNDKYLQEFIDRHDFSDDELRVLYNLFVQ